MCNWFPDGEAVKSQLKNTVWTLMEFEADKKNVKLINKYW